MGRLKTLEFIEQCGKEEALDLHLRFNFYPPWTDLDNVMRCAREALKAVKQNDCERLICLQPSVDPGNLVTVTQVIDDFRLEPFID